MLNFTLDLFKIPGQDNHFFYILNPTKQNIETFESILKLLEVCEINPLQKILFELTRIQFYNEIYKDDPKVFLEKISGLIDLVSKINLDEDQKYLYEITMKMLIFIFSFYLFEDSRYDQMKKLHFCTKFLNDIIPVLEKITSSRKVDNLQEYFYQCLKTILTIPLLPKYLFSPFQWYIKWFESTSCFQRSQEISEILNSR